MVHSDAACVALTLFATQYIGQLGWCSVHCGIFIQCSKMNRIRTRVAEVARGHGGPPPKSLDLDENFKPEHTLFCRNLCAL